MFIASVRSGESPSVTVRRAMCSLGCIVTQPNIALMTEGDPSLPSLLLRKWL